MREPVPARAAVDLAALVDERPMSLTQILVAALAASALFVDGYDIQVMALAVPALSRDWHLPESAFGLALSAIVIGLTVGAGFIGPLGDRIGRKTMLAATMLITAFAMAGTALATSPMAFVGWRLATGLALGAGIPNCAALTSEYAPVARRSLMVGLMNTASPLGAFAAGFIAPLLLAAFGWRGAFVIGGVAPMVVALLTLALIPESLKFLAIRRPGDPRIAKILRRIAPDLDPDGIEIVTPPPSPHASLLKLIGRDYWARSVLLWSMLALNLFNLYILISWLPTLLEHSGWSSDAALQGSVLIQAGGVVGGIFMATRLDRGETRMVLLGGFGLAALCLLLFGIVPSGAGWVALLLFLGAGVSGCQLCLNVLSAAYYPPAIKATGVSGALLIGSIGSIVAPIAGAWMLDKGLSTISFLALLAIPALVCALGVALMRREWQAH